MEWLLLSLSILLASGLAAWVLRRESIGLAGAIVGCAAGLAASAAPLLTGCSCALSLPWSVPYGSFHLEIDALSAFFLLPLFLVGALSAVYAYGYLEPYRRSQPLGRTWFFYNALVASMALVVTARNAVLFLTAWEAMALTSFFLVVFESERKDAREAGWSYLVASHLGTAFLIILFVWLGSRAGSLEFERFGNLDNRAAGMLFLLALIGFGTKAGFFPLHVWLPEAHPAAPSHVSALMSGVMIKMGIYGLLRIYICLGPGPAWWGWLMVAVGVVSGVLGVLFALAQSDLKRLLAYSSVENIGIIALGLGLGMLGRSLGIPALAALGFAGGLLHLLNHALFKSLLFLGAGAVAHSAGTRDIEHLGGLAKAMPWTAGFFLLGAVAICGLPPLNGFVGEFLILLGAYHGACAVGHLAAAGAAAIAAIALIGGLAAACFTRAFGIVFLGQPRRRHTESIHEVGWSMRIPMAVLAASCVAIGLGAPWLFASADRVLGPLGVGAGSWAGSGARGCLLGLTLLWAGLLAVALAAAGFRRWLLGGRPIGEGGTWDCGYDRPSERMQYTASSFAQPLISLFAPVLRTRRELATPTGYYPGPADLATTTPDIASRRLFSPAYEAMQALLARFRWLQHGYLQLYVLQLAVTLLVLLIWKLG